jgi:hypothetical protein
VSKVQFIYVCGGIWKGLKRRKFLLSFRLNGHNTSSATGLQGVRDALGAYRSSISNYSRVALPKNNKEAALSQIQQNAKPKRKIREAGYFWGQPKCFFFGSSPKTLKNGGWIIPDQPKCSEISN